MKNTIRVDFQNKRIVMDRAFAKNCENPSSIEYATLQRVRQDYPTFAVGTRSCTKNPKQERYAGLTYEYMENYIFTHEKGQKLQEAMAEYEELRLIAECHSKSRRYPVIKSWFLNRYPDIAQFGLFRAELDEGGKPVMKVLPNSQMPVEAVDSRLRAGNE